jgi:hypothetical protein
MPNTPEHVAAAVIRAADVDVPPCRVVVGHDAWSLITQGLSSRLIEVAAQRADAVT